MPGGISTPVLIAECCTGCGACVATCPTRAITVR
jgi:ferredoxin-type protein NapF